MDGPTFEKWFADELKENKEFANRWREHEQYYERHKEYFGKTFDKQGTGDWNLFKLFIERDLSLVREGGQFSLLVPSSIQTDEGCADLRRWFITEHRLDELTSFENRGYKVIENGREKTKQIFPDVDSRFKFGFFQSHQRRGHAQGSFLRRAVLSPRPERLFIHTNSLRC